MTDSDRSTAKVILFPGIRSGKIRSDARKASFVNFRTGPVGVEHLTPIKKRSKRSAVLVLIRS